MELKFTFISPLKPIEQINKKQQHPGSYCAHSHASHIKQHLQESPRGSVRLSGEGLGRGWGTLCNSVNTVIPLKSGCLGDSDTELLTLVRPRLSSPHKAPWTVCIQHLCVKGSVMLPAGSVTQDKLKLETQFTEGD